MDVLDSSRPQSLALRTATESKKKRRQLLRQLKRHQKASKNTLWQTDSKGPEELQRPNLAEGEQVIERPSLIEKNFRLDPKSIHPIRRTANDPTHYSGKILGENIAAIIFGFQYKILVQIL